MDRGVFEYAKYGSIGISWVLVTSIYIYLGFTAGSWLDRRLHASPLFLVLGLLLAVALSLRSLVAEVMALIEETGGGQKGKGDEKPPAGTKGRGSGKNTKT